MINNFNFDTEDQYLKYLMTSDFLEDELSPREMKMLLLKFRYFYRVSNAKQDSLINQLENSSNRIFTLNRKIDELELDIKNNNIKFDTIIKRDLTLKERLLGKIFEVEYYRRFHLFKNK